MFGARLSQSKDSTGLTLVLVNESPEQSQNNADKSNNTSKLSTGGDIIP